MYLKSGPSSPSPTTLTVTMALNSVRCLLSTFLTSLTIITAKKKRATVSACSSIVIDDDDDNNDVDVVDVDAVDVESEDSNEDEDISGAFSTFHYCLAR